MLKTISRKFQRGENWIGLLIAPLALLLLGVSWSIASPLGSSADEDFHAASIWCAWGESETCEIAPDGTGVNVPGSISKSTCYISWPASTGVGCLKNFNDTSEYNDELVNTTRVSLDTWYSPFYFKAARSFVGPDVEKSVLSIRFFNVSLASLVFLWALAIATPSVRRALALSWGLVLIPVGMFFMASINPSSWLIISIGTYWAFLATALTPGVEKKRRIFACLGALASALLALGSRTDAVIYLVITSIAIAALQWKAFNKHLSKGFLIALVSIFSLVMVLGGLIFFRRFTLINLTWGSDVPSGGLPAPLKTLTEMPSFILGLFGGQGSFSEVKLAYENLPGIKTSGFTYGLGWTEFEIPAFIGVFGAVCTFAVMFLVIRRISASKALSITILVLAFAAVILALRAQVDFNNTSHVQPRYLFPLFIASVGIMLISQIKRNPLLSRTQAGLVVSLLTIAGATAWLATATRYAVGPNALMTDFGQPHEWWSDIGPGRLGWFLFTLLVTGAWLYSTVWVMGRMHSSPKIQLPTVNSTHG